MTGVSVVQVIAGRRAAVPPGAPGTSLRLQPLPAPDIPGSVSKPKGAPRKYQKLGIFLHGDALRGGWGFLGIQAGREWGLSPLGSRRGCGSTAGRCLGREGNGGVDEGARLVTELSESGAGDELIIRIAGHVSRAMLSRYSHVQMEAKRRACDEVAARQCAADEKRQKEAERQRRDGGTSQPALIQ